MPSAWRAAAILDVQQPVEHSLQGQLGLARVVRREKARARRSAVDAATPAKTSIERRSAWSIPAIRCRRCPAIPRAAGWSACCAPASSPSRPSSTRRIRPIPREVYDRALVLSEVCDAINATDASGANSHMSSVGICSLLTRVGYAVIMQISCRDRNRIAIQGDVLGAAAMGVANILCLTGDGVQAGDQPGAKPVFDLDSISLLQTIRTMRDDRRFLSGRKITVPPQVFIGAAANPFVPP